jgi:hypothetical protein
MEDPAHVEFRVAVPDIHTGRMEHRVVRVPKTSPEQETDAVEALLGIELTRENLLERRYITVDANKAAPLPAEPWVDPRPKAQHASAGSGPAHREES